MIEIIKLANDAPYKVLTKFYSKTKKNCQKNIDAICISSLNLEKKEVDSRLVNLKRIHKDEWIFFTNYSSKKAQDFQNHNQISALLFWSSINVQIRMKAKIRKTSRRYNEQYFDSRSQEKNALAISSNQSKNIGSYHMVLDKYHKALDHNDLSICPNYWGGYSFTPYYFEFWQGHDLRINKREVFDKTDGVWKHSFLQP